MVFKGTQPKPKHIGISVWPSFSLLNLNYHHHFGPKCLQWSDLPFLKFLCVIQHYRWFTEWILCSHNFSSGIIGGFTDALCGLPGYFVIHLVDKGFKQYFGNQRSFLDELTTLEAGLGGRVRHFSPADAGDDWFDRVGVPHPVPVTPLERGKLLFDLQANSTRAFCTGHRWPVELSNGRDWGTCKM